MKIKLFVTREIQYFELGIFCFNSYLYYLTRGFIASVRAFNLLTRVLNLPTRTFNLETRVFSLLTSEFELVTRNSCFTFRHRHRTPTINFTEKCTKFFFFEKDTKKKHKTFK